tara:strand:- start:1755 stop:2258 length:504 start_codon:yes stop_codon:yes gene_type:complete
MQLFISFLFILSTLLSTSLHEYHLSNTEIRYNEEESALQIITRIFIDDLEETLRKNGHSGLFLCTEREPEHAEALIADYLEKNLLIKVDGKAQKFSYLGKEISDDLIAAWCYLEILDITPTIKIEVENNVLLDSFDDQKNIVNVKTDSGKRAMFILQNGENSGVLDL